jgi:hypothetical protein
MHVFYIYRVSDNWMLQEPQSRKQRTRNVRHEIKKRRRRGGGRKPTVARSVAS